jgi:hypothetical protein
MFKIKNCMTVAVLFVVITPAIAEKLDGDVVGCVAESKLDQHLYALSVKKFAIAEALIATGECMYLPDGATVSMISKGGGMLKVDYRGRRLFIPAWTNMK